jgi:hypothetical protein
VRVRENDCVCERERELAVIVSFSVYKGVKQSGEGEKVCVSVSVSMKL